MSVTYTAGPWSICKDHPDWICPPGGGYPVAMVPPGQGAVAAANARLIATAPELVDALAGMLEQFGEHGGPVVRQARAVLAKAAFTAAPRAAISGARNYWNPFGTLRKAGRSWSRGSRRKIR